MPAPTTVATQDLDSDHITSAGAADSSVTPEQPARRTPLVVAALLILVAAVAVFLVGQAYPGLVAPIVALAVLAFAATWPWLLCGRHL